MSGGDFFFSAKPGFVDIDPTDEAVIALVRKIQAQWRGRKERTLFSAVWKGIRILRKQKMRKVGVRSRLTKAVGRLKWLRMSEMRRKREAEEAKKKRRAKFKMFARKAGKSVKKESLVDVIKRERAFRQDFIRKQREALIALAEMEDMDLGDMYSAEALETRSALAFDPTVRECTASYYHGINDAAGIPRHAAGPLTKGQYKELMWQLSHALIVDFDPNGFDGVIEKDWLNDSKGEGSLSFEKLHFSMFELADVWCETIDAGDYAAFLRRLLGEVDLKKATRATKKKGRRR